MLTLILLKATLIGLTFASPPVMDMMDTFNNLRATAGLAPVCYSTKLESSAQKHSDFQGRAGQMSMLRDKLSSQITAENFIHNGVGEAIGTYSSDSASELVEFWLNSPPRIQVIQGDFTHFGIARKTVGSKTYWTMHMAKAANPNEPCSGNTTTSTGAVSSTSPTLHSPASSTSLPPSSTLNNLATNPGSQSQTLSSRKVCTCTCTV